tara:strand:- start:50050 stop:51948 length:1899 start_codon:yes stop_codon:yes gene_type:complete
MSRIRQAKTTFTAGEVSRDLLGRGDLNAYENGALTLRNIFIHPTGGVSRRAGTYYIDNAAGAGRLIPFEFNTQQTYLLVVSDHSMAIYLDGTKITDIVTPWPEEQIAQLAWTQSADTLLLAHPLYPPKQLLRLGDGSWALQDWAFFEDNNRLFQPYYKFAGSSVTLTPSALSGAITITASENIFVLAHEGARLRLGDKEVLITDFESPTVVSAQTQEDLIDTAATIDWQEQAFSAVRGYPVTLAFHQDRLVIGGSRDLPNRIWFSKSGDLFNFDLGEGLDDESIEFSILSDQVNAIRAVFSGRHLQVFTSGAEWMVTGSPLTPSTVELLRQTRIGSVIDRYIPPIDVDGATLFIARNQQEIREFLYTDVEQAYSSTDLALLSRHVIKEPLDQDYDKKRRLLFIARSDGRFATLTVYRAEQVAAWTVHETLGNVKSISVVGDTVYLLVERNGNYLIEVFDDESFMDSALSGSSIEGALSWSGLDHLEGQYVDVLADDIRLDPQLVTGGNITLASPAHKVMIGLSFTHIIEPLPPNIISESGGGRAIRLVEALFRMEETQALRLDVGRGLQDVPLKQMGDESVLGTPPPIVSADIRMRALGWARDLTKPLWRIEQSDPRPFTLLSVISEIKVND